MCGASWSELQNCFDNANSESAFSTCLEMSGFDLQGAQTSDGMIENDGDTTTTGTLKDYFLLKGSTFTTSPGFEGNPRDLFDIRNRNELGWSNNPSQEAWARIKITKKIEVDGFAFLTMQNSRNAPFAATVYFDVDGITTTDLAARKVSRIQADS